MSSNNYEYIEIDTQYQVYAGVSLVFHEIISTTVDNGDIYVGVGVTVTNSRSNDIRIESRDFVCAAYHGVMWDEFKEPDLTLDYNDNRINFPIAIASGNSQYLTIGFKVPDDATMAVFAYTNVWGTDESNPSYIYMVTE